jgi:hypothetical protein
MYAILYTLVIAGHLFTVPGNSRFAYGNQCEAHLHRAMKSVIPISDNARLVSAKCEIMEGEVKI